MSQKLLRTAIAAGLALALGGCSLFSSDSPRAPVKLTEIQQSATVNTVWSTKLGSSEHSFLTPHSPATDSMRRARTKSSVLIRRTVPRSGPPL